MCRSPEPSRLENYIILLISLSVCYLIKMMSLYVFHKTKGKQIWGHIWWKFFVCNICSDALNSIYPIINPFFDRSNLIIFLTSYFRIVSQLCLFSIQKYSHSNFWKKYGLFFPIWLSHSCLIGLIFNLLCNSLRVLHNSVHCCPAVQVPTLHILILF